MRHPVDPAEVEFLALRAQGPGGQNVNKVASAVQLRFDIAASSLPEAAKARLLASGDSRINDRGVVVIKAQSFRNQQRNRADALARLQQLVDAACKVVRPRRATAPGPAARRRRLEAKRARSLLKAARSASRSE